MLSARGLVGRASRESTELVVDAVEALPPRLHKVSFFVLYNYVPNSEYVDPVEGPPEGQPSEGLTLWRLSHRVHRNYCFWLVVDFVISSKFT